MGGTGFRAPMASACRGRCTTPCLYLVSGWSSARPPMAEAGWAPSCGASLGSGISRTSSWIGGLRRARQLHDLRDQDV
eukprot:scaffold28993_cov34-Phaeocystis_antarctica.AAC.6